jgi:hypothetical protein
MPEVLTVFGIVTVVCAPAGDEAVPLRAATAMSTARSTLNSGAAGSSGPRELFCIDRIVRIPVMWATDYGVVGRHRSEATLVVFYISYLTHMSQEKGK